VRFQGTDTSAGRPPEKCPADEQKVVNQLWTDVTARLNKAQEKVK
jgi:hypothetical protein